MSAVEEDHEREFSGAWARGATGLVALFALIYFAVAVWQLQDRTIDDGFIFFRLAQNFVDGHGIVWNVGEQATEGATNFLHFAGISALMFLGLDPRIASLVLSSMCAVAICALVWRAMGKRLGPLLPTGTVLLAVFLLDERVTIHAAVGGLGSLIDGLAAVGVWLAALAMLGKPTGKSWMVLGVTAFLACIARPTGALFTAVLYTVLLVNAALEARAGNGQRLRSWMLACGVTLIGGIGFAAFKLVYFGYLLPNSYYLKSTASAAIDWSVVGEYLKYSLTPLAIPLVVALAFTTRRSLRSLFADSHATTRCLSTVLPPLAVVIYYTCSTVVSTATFRFFFPSYVFFFAALLCLLPACTRGKPSLRAGVLFLSALTALGLAFHRGQERSQLSFPPQRAAMRPLEGELVLIGKALAETGLGHSATLLNDSAGAIPYFSDFHHLDRGGLVTNQLSGRDPLTALEREEFIWSQNIDLYIGWEPQASQGVMTPQEDQRVHTPYVKICLVREARDATTVRAFAPSLDLLHLRMRELRDRWQLLGQIEPADYWEDAWNVKCLAYVRRDSPHRAIITKALAGLIEVRPRDVDLQAVPKGAEINFLDRLFEETGGDFAVMAQRFLGDRRLAPLVRSRYRMLH